MTFATISQGPRTFYDRGRLISDIFMLINDIQANETQTNLSVNKNMHFLDTSSKTPHPRQQRQPKCKYRNIVTSLKRLKGEV